MALAAPSLIPVVLELGGNDAAYVRADANLERAANGILWSGFSNAGQSCGGAQRILVHESVYAPFVELLSQRIRKLRVGPGDDWNSDMGAMTSAKQKKAVQDQVATCVAAGAQIAAQSAAPAVGNFLPAVVLTGVTATMPVMREEIFGPVVAVVSVKSDEQAIELANATPMGLTSSVWSRDHHTAREIAARIRAGAVMINDHLMSHGLAETPWGGFGDSGIGRTHGEAGLAEMVRLQVVVDDLLPFASKNIWWHPYSQKVYNGLRGLIHLLYGPGLGRRLAAIPKALGVFLRYWER
jgi:succinate-semialdehyde dehydrogenase/glutarate-semialdehyde dehydrogenase